MESPSASEREKVRSLREQLPATEGSIYLNTGTAGPLPAETLAAMRQLEDYELRYGRASTDALEELFQRMAEARAVVAALLHADPEAIALTHSTTEGLNVAAWAPDWREGDEVVTTTIEHAGLLAPLAALRGRAGVTVRLAEVGDGGDDDRTLAAIEGAMTSRTRLVMVSHVSWLTGARLPVERIVALAHERDCWVAIDGAQSAGAISVDALSLGADFYAVSAQKWLLGPEGMGALVVSRRVVEEARQGYAGWFSSKAVAPDGIVEPWPDARRFDSTSFNRPAVGGFARSVGWLAMHVDLAWAYERSARLARATAAALDGIPGVTVVTPRERMATLVAFRIAGWPPAQALDAIRRRSFAVLRTLDPREALRASVGWFNSEDELDRFVASVAEVARHTPESLPPRPELTILPG
jgi:L-cysteine/cystine lyase